MPPGTHTRRAGRKPIKQESIDYIRIDMQGDISGREGYIKGTEGYACLGRLAGEKCKSNVYKWKR